MMGRQTGDQSQLFYLFNLEELIPASSSVRRPTEKKPSKGLRPAVFRQSCNITGEEWVYASVAGRSSPVIVGWSTRNLPACPGPP